MSGPYHSTNHTDNELRPCPFCGGASELMSNAIESDWWCGEVFHKCDLGKYEAKAKCGFCHVQMICGGGTEEEAVSNVIELWNRRVDEDRGCDSVRV